MPFVGLLFSLLLFAIVVGLVYWFWRVLPLPEPIRSYVLCFLILILLIAVIYYWPTMIAGFAGATRK